MKKSIINICAILASFSSLFLMSCSRGDKNTESQDPVICYQKAVLAKIKQGAHEVVGTNEKGNTLVVYRIQGNIKLNASIGWDDCIEGSLVENTKEGGVIGASRITVCPKDFKDLHSDKDYLLPSHILSRLEAQSYFDDAQMALTASVLPDNKKAEIEGLFNKTKSIYDGSAQWNLRVVGSEVNIRSKLCLLYVSVENAPSTGNKTAFLLRVVDGELKQ